MYDHEVHVGYNCFMTTEINSATFASQLMMTPPISVRYICSLSSHGRQPQLLAQLSPKESCAHGTPTHPKCKMSALALLTLQGIRDSLSIHHKVT